MKLAATVGDKEALLTPRCYYIFVLVTGIPALVCLLGAAALVFAANFLLMGTHHLELRITPKAYGPPEPALWDLALTFAGVVFMIYGLWRLLL